MTWAGKFLIARDRLEFLTVEATLSPSFPSAHSAGAMAVYAFVAWLWRAPQAGPQYDTISPNATIMVIGCVAMSRVVLSVHFATDIVAGLCIGIGVALTREMEHRQTVR